jgi:mycofactocin system glycosyltransferase
VPAGNATRTAASDVSVVIPVFPDAADLTMTIERLGPVAACVVVDDGTGDPEVAAVGERHGAQIERHDTNRGPAAARNTGWRRTSTDVVAFVDPNCTPEPDWLDRLLPHFDDAEVVAVAPRITTRLELSLPRFLQDYERARGSLDRGQVEGTVRPGSRVPFVPSTALLVRRQALEEVGGFDQGLRFGEDVDLVWRLVEAGGTVRYEPTVTVSHGSRRTASTWLRQRFAYGGSAAPLASRHRRAVAPLTVSAWTAGAWALIGLGFPVAGVGVAAGSSAALVPRLQSLSRPWPEAARLAGLGHLYGGARVADAVRRTWWPIALAAALVSRRARRAVLATATVPLLLDWRQERPRLDPARWVALRLVDDIAYGAGVWAGCWRERSIAALIPDLSSWPGRRPAVEPN